MINQDWDLKPRATQCGQCQTPFAQGQEYVSRLTYGPQGYERLDCCGACWAQGQGAAEAISVWHGVFEMPPPPEPEPVKKETAESLLRALLEKNDPAQGNVLFILAVMLERRRVLVEREVQRRAGGKLVRIYEHRQTGDSFIITDPQLRLDQVKQVQTEVMALLAAPAPAQAVPPS
ncbi:MAG: hypothetical protein HYV36_02090 [Lentisphaerae bacterium]|nr:hypothetical protein [Lentisphaerota bacterium]